MNTRYVLFLMLPVALGIVLPLGAQVVVDDATSTWSNVTNTFTDDATAGTNGAFTLRLLPQLPVRVTLRSPESLWKAVTANQRAAKRL